METEYEIVFYTGHHDGDTNVGIYHIYNTIGQKDHTRDNFFYTEQSRFRFTRANVYENKKPSKKLWFIYNRENNFIPVPNMIFASRASLQRYLDNDLNLKSQIYDDHKFGFGWVYDGKTIW